MSSASREAAAVRSEESGLDSRALRFPGVVVQGVTYIAPAIGAVLLLPLVVAEAGVAAPVIFVICLAVIATLAIALTQLAKVFPSAGGYYTFISRAVAHRLGWLVGWIQYPASLLAPAATFVYLGYLINSSTEAQFSFQLPWEIPFFFGIIVLGVAMYRGVKISVRVQVALLAFEMLTLLALAISGFVSAGPGGFNFQPFYVVHAPAGGSVFLGLVYTLLAYQGFEGITPLAEETPEPRRTLPRALIATVIIVGVFFIVTSWGILVGWGTSHVASFAGATLNPVILLGQRLWGGGQFVITLVFLNSVVAANIAASNTATRTIYAMGRAGTLPAVFGRVHSRFRTPTAAIVLELLVTTCLGLILGFAFGPANQYAVMGLFIEYAILVVYVLGNVAVFWYFFTSPDRKFNIFLHLLCPLVSTAALVIVGYKAIIPLPTYPGSVGGIFAAVWVVAGVLAVVVRRKQLTAETAPKAV